MSSEVSRYLFWGACSLSQRCPALGTAGYEVSFRLTLATSPDLAALKTRMLTFFELEADELVLRVVSTRRRMLSSAYEVEVVINTNDNFAKSAVQTKMTSASVSTLTSTIGAPVTSFTPVASKDVVGGGSGGSGGGSSAGIVIGAVLGGLAFAAIVGFLLFNKVCKPRTEATKRLSSPAVHTHRTSKSEVPAEFSHGQLAEVKSADVRINAL